ncbi:ATP-binding protein [Streptomyces sp. NBC_00247]|uniref:sensor histidine kinase n=1 Tax=Streptomyces sp. NBC_00247 TaxID=2975689 RepID=UPI002E2A2E42|nr:ATP-binding protein [Streptomyces sp. NBC_00247]
MSGAPPLVAQQLHDGVLQALAIARLHLDRALAQDGPLPRELGMNLQLLMDREIAGLRRLINGSPPPTPPEPDLPRALAAIAEELQSVTGIRILVEDRTEPPGRWTGNDPIAYRAVREALHNTIKHSDAEHAWVTVAAREDLLVCTVHDDGRGFDPATVRSHFGLTSVYAQAREAGGHLAVQSCRTGTSVTLVLPRNPVLEGKDQQ